MSGTLPVWLFVLLSAAMLVAFVRFIRRVNAWQAQLGWGGFEVHMLGWLVAVSAVVGWLAMSFPIGLGVFIALYLILRTLAFWLVNKGGAS